jgi:hypothetical protein
MISYPVLLYEGDFPVLEVLSVSPRNSLSAAVHRSARPSACAAGPDGRYMFWPRAAASPAMSLLGVRLARTARYNPSGRFNAKDIGR